MAQIIGRITKDATVYHTETGKAVVNFSFVENYTYKNKNGEKIEQTTYYKCALWNRENAAKYLTKGTVLQITGFLATDNYTDAEGNHKSQIKITVHSFDFLPQGKKDKTNETATFEKAPVTVPATGSEDDLPF